MTTRTHRRPNFSDLTKNINKRKYLWIVASILFLIADEYVKEGYFFDPGDLTIYGTHEFLIGLLVALLVTLGIYDLTKNNQT